MRQIRLSGSEGGGAEVIIGPPHPYQKHRKILDSHFRGNDDNST